MGKPVVEVTGLREVQRAIRLVGDTELKGALRDANRGLAQQVVRKALPKVPVKTGRLRKSVRALASQNSAVVKAGTAAVPYAAAQHWGVGPRPGRRGPHNIKARPFLRDAARTVEQKAADEYLDQIHRILKKAGLDG